MLICAFLKFGSVQNVYKSLDNTITGVIQIGKIVIWALKNRIGNVVLTEE